MCIRDSSYIRKYAGSEEEYLEGVAVIERQAQKMSLLINRLLDMTRLEFGTRKLAKEDTDVSLMVETLCEELDTGARGISLERDIKAVSYTHLDVYKRQHRTSVIAIGDLRIDTGSHSVVRGTRPIELSSREYAILEYLALNQGKVLSREQIENLSLIHIYLNLYICHFHYPP